MKAFRTLAAAFLLISWAVSGASADPIEISKSGDRRVTVVVRDAPVAEVFEMLSRSENVSVVLGEQVEGNVSLSLFDADVREAIHAIAQAAGYAVETRDDAYLVVERDEMGQDHDGGTKQVRSFKVQYSDTEKVREILEKHLSRYGEITALEERRMLVVEDLPEFLDRVDRILTEIDRDPKQILLEAQILEISLTSSDTLGIDWAQVANINGGTINVGVRGLTSGSAPGLFFDILKDNFQGAIEALSEQGRVRALATPRLLTLENQEAEVLVGDRLGFRVTTTINQVTTESVEFIDSGVILRFKPSVDREGRVLLEIHPEVSTGIVSDGIPNVTTTEVTTQLLADSGQRIFIGGLLRDRASEGRRGVPLLSRVPFLGMLFARSEWANISTETVVIVTPTVVGTDGQGSMSQSQKGRLQHFEPSLDERREKMEDDLDVPWARATLPDSDDAGDDASDEEPAAADPAAIDPKDPAAAPQDPIALENEPAGPAAPRQDPNGLQRLRRSGKWRP